MRKGRVGEVSCMPADLFALAVWSCLGVEHCPKSWLSLRQGGVAHISHSYSVHCGMIVAVALLFSPRTGACPLAKTPKTAPEGSTKTMKLPTTSPPSHKWAVGLAQGPGGSSAWEPHAVPSQQQAGCGRQAERRETEEQKELQRELAGRKLRLEGLEEMQWSDSLIMAGDWQMHVQRRQKPLSLT